ncbi:MAG: methylmalonyl-CoA mutase family protein [Flavobacteriaceae bacterium]|jgi:methylmalonyl-CoA mutase|nr:methylmalonyl-CoA mutase family protein [Flavobacteriaceae bacterium]MDP4802355.1 methylmalonyl-CoA mutase family protein [Flavobacteriaceae bacterium]MDP5024465.1 methylmalonyl-CoA mutase family protein [Flavobacteriaceae bacterium]
MNKQGANTAIFSPVSGKAWKQRIQYELDGADYNEQMLRESSDGIKTKPFYTREDLPENFSPNTQENQPFHIGIEVFCNNSKMSFEKALWSFEKGCDQVKFLVQENIEHPLDLANHIPENKSLIFELQKANSKQLNSFIGHLNTDLKKSCRIQLDPISQFFTTGNWWSNQQEDLDLVCQLAALNQNPRIVIDSRGFESAGASISQQLAYALAHAHEYILLLSEKKLLDRIQTFEFIFNTRSSDFFMEISKLRAFEILWNNLKKLYQFNTPFELSTQPSKIDQTLFQNNHNLIRNTSSLMAGILGNCQHLYGLAFDHIHKKNHPYSDRLSINQMLILKHECGLSGTKDPVIGSFAIAHIAFEIAEKALSIFKSTEANGGLIAGLKNNSIQKAIHLQFEKQMELYRSGKRSLLGANLLFELEELTFEKYPFLRIDKRKTLITPLIPKRYATYFEQKALKDLDANQ